MARLMIHIFPNDGRAFGCRLVRADGPAHVIVERIEDGREYRVAASVVDEAWDRLCAAELSAR